MARVRILAEVNCIEDFRLKSEIGVHTSCASFRFSTDLLHLMFNP